jgi:hypothetical protein
MRDMLKEVRNILLSDKQDSEKIAEMTGVLCITRDKFALKSADERKRLIMSGVYIIDKTDRRG